MTSLAVLIVLLAIKYATANLLICQYGLIIPIFLVQYIHFLRLIWIGGYCRTNSDCVLGNKCAIQNQYYSQCIPDPTQYQSGNCLQNWGSRCSSSTVCCDPGSICNTNNNPNYPQCVQIQSPNCVYPHGFGSNAPSSPVTLAPTSSNLKGYPTALPTVVASSRIPSVAPFSTAGNWIKLIDCIIWDYLLYSYETLSFLFQSQRSGSFWLTRKSQLIVGVRLSIFLPTSDIMALSLLFLTIKGFTVISLTRTPSISQALFVAMQTVLLSWRWPA